MIWVEWMKGICHLWSRGRHFSPSLPGDRYLKLSSQKRSPGRNLGEHRLVRRSGTTSRGTLLLVLSLRMRSFPTTEFDSICVGKSIRLLSIKYTAFTRPRLFNIWIRLSVCWLAHFFAMFAVLKILQLTSYQIVRKMKKRTGKCPSISPPPPSRKFRYTCEIHPETYVKLIHTLVRWYDDYA